jgi:hypothetical protein
MYMASWLCGCGCGCGRYEGVYGFFRGLVPNCLRVAPASAITFLVYEELLKLL